MKRREFFKVIGGAALAMVGVRAVQARVCERQNGLLDRVYPVGSIYMTIASGNPGSILGGTWVAWGGGRVPVGVQTGDAEFGTVQATGGARTHTLTIAQMPNHDHSGTRHPLYSRSAGGPAHTVADFNSSWANTGLTGGGQAHNNLQPYITVFMWRRTG